MIILTKYKIICKDDGSHFVENEGAVRCPICGTILKHRDYRKRHMLLEGGKDTVLYIERLICSFCHRLQTALPDCLVPYKHYASRIIQDVIDGKITPETLETEDGPSEWTMARWRKWFDENAKAKKDGESLEGYLMSLLCRYLGYYPPLGAKPPSLIDRLRQSESHWLRKLIQIIYNSGGRLRSLQEMEDDESRDTYLKVIGLT